MKTCPYDFPIPITIFRRSLYHDELRKTFGCIEGGLRGVYVDMDTFVHNFFSSREDIIRLDYEAMGYKDAKGCMHALGLAIKNNRMQNSIFYFMRKNKLYLVRS